MRRNGDHDDASDATDDHDGVVEAVGDNDDVPDVPAVRDEVLEALVTFVRALRRAGIDVSANAAVVGARALVEVGFDDEARARAALRAALVTRAEDVATFDRMFAEFWRRLTASLDGDDGAGMAEDAPDGALAPLGEEAAEETPDEAADSSEETPSDGDEAALVSRALEAGPATEADEEASRATYSPAGRPETVTVDLNTLIDDSLDAAVDRLVTALATLSGRRWRRAEAGRRTDARRALRRSVATGGAVVSVPERARRETALRTLVLADVSRSVLDTVDRGFFLRFLRALAARVRHNRVFFFDSDVREVSAAFDAPTTADAVRELQRSETSWGGGTRIGHAVRTVQRDHSEAVDRRTAVFVLSDGLEQGEVDELERGMSWLSRQSRAVLWLNPLAASPAYEPTAAGMATVLPFVDGLFAFTDTADITEMARQLEQYGTASAIGFRHDPRRAQSTTSSQTTHD